MLDNLKIKLFRLANNYLYKNLPPGLCTFIAISPLGKNIFRLVNGVNINRIKVYNGEYGIKLRLSYNEALVLGFLHLGTINPLESKFLHKNLKPGSIVVDIGVYVDGWYSILASKKIGNSGSIIAFEPVSKFAKRLKENLRINRVKNVTVEEVAVSDRSGFSDFYVLDGASSLIKKNTYIGSRGKIKKIKVKTTSLDKYLTSRKIAKVDFVKIDVEGEELKVLRGASNLLKGKNPPDLLIEVYDDLLKNNNSSEKELIEYLKKFKYNAYSFKSGRLSPYNVGSIKILKNLFFTKKLPPKLKYS